MKQPAVFCVDWGTSSFRLWAPARDGEILAERRSELGMSKLAPADYEAVLEGRLAELNAPAEVPVVICGMAGAAQGWREAAYLNLPADLAAIPRQAVRVPAIRREVRILPGLYPLCGEYPFLFSPRADRREFEIRHGLR